MIDTQPAEGTQLERGQTVTLVVSTGPARSSSPTSWARRATTPARRSPTPGSRSPSTEQETPRRTPGTVLTQNPAALAKADRARPSRYGRQGARAGRRAEVGDDEATATERARAPGFKVEDAASPTRRRTASSSRRAPRAARRKPGSTVTIGVGHASTPADDARRRPRARRPRRAATPERTPVDAMRVAVLAGGRSSEHDVSLASGAAVREGLAPGGPRGAVGRDRAATASGATTAASSPCTPGAGCSAPTSCSRCCTARSARTAPCRACSSCSTCPTSAPGVLASAVCMDKVVFKELMARAGLPQVRYVGVDEARWRDDRERRRGEVARARPAGVRQAGAPGVLGRDRPRSPQAERARGGAGRGVRATTRA